MKHLNSKSVIFLLILCIASCLDNTKELTNNKKDVMPIKNELPDNCFKKLNLPFKSDDIDFKYDSLGYAILNENQCCNSEKLKVHFGNNNKIFPVGMLNSKNYNFYILGQNNLGEENLEPTIYGYTFTHEGKKIDSLELQINQLWDYSRRKTFSLSLNMEFTILDAVVIKDLSTKNAETKKNTEKYKIDENGNILKK